MRKHKRGAVYFNIVGRASSNDWRFEEGTTQIDWSGYSGGHDTSGKRVETITLIFDLSPFKEKEPRRAYAEVSERSKEYRIDDPQAAAAWQGLQKGRETTEELKEIGLMNEKSELLADTEYGFVLSYRVAPRLFGGIVVRPSSEDPEVVVKRVHEIASLMLEAYRDKKAPLVPIYDSKGNLLWPKSLAYKDVKELIAQKE
ncbi:MAG: hypothetical protein A2939_02395 [Parcubacteria group bacterium RIFCSPLOWO2_01_FULL_48_18]|nr:MAG: hypothetical protein A3J67_02390 [Parcubacteria group bacterium RIFCSPHIGHO2_02_FULL_48_10b]OHB23238.1 MAG: hypothetical protein A2939_02395 [Parcubacteria group bacterium RIFCSPLOWO2_01_FULL_48_18]